MIQQIGDIVKLGAQTIVRWRSIWRQRKKIIEQMYEIGNASLLMACILSFFIGGVLALQSGPALVDRGLGSIIGQLVGLAICKELAPVMMAILVAGRAGSAMAAEIGSMKVYQEIDALRTMNIDPITYLVLPRLLAITVVLPLLVIYSILTGWLGGSVIAAFNLEIEVPFNVYFLSLKSNVDIFDILNGLLKSCSFAFAIGMICCSQGLNTTRGPRGIGRSVTRAVVFSIVAILVLDYLITRLFLYFN